MPKTAKDPLLSSSYRAISILPALRKVWEHTCKMHIEKCLGRDPFHKDQYGLRRSRSTIDMPRRVCGIAECCRRRGIVCVMVALYIKNAFYTLRWRTILEETRDRRLPGQLMRILEDYLSARRIVAHCPEGKIKRYMFAGVPQGLVLGPLLWNLVYDGFLRALDSLKDVDAVAFTDDLALIITARKMKISGTGFAVWSRGRCYGATTQVFSWQQRRLKLFH